MKMIDVTPNGPQFSQIIAGMMRSHEWGLDADGLRGWIEAALDLGITTFDHADIYGNYGNEGFWGRAMGGHTHLRDKLQIVTKCGIQLLSDTRPDTIIHHYNTTYYHIIWSAERSLRELQTDYLDVLLIHRPDPLMRADEMARALSKLHQDGKIRYAGVSNFTPSQYNLLQDRLDIPLVTNQVEFSVLYLDPIYDGTLDQCQQLRRAPMVWSPVAGGRIFRADDERSQRVLAILDELANQHGVSAAEIALAWIMQHPANPMPVMGTGKLDRLQEAINASAWHFDRQAWFRVLEASQGHEVP